jgi:UDPglucose 6-dehydrogenase
MHIAVIGTGYVGLVTGACFAEFGVDVTCVDVDEDKISQLLKGVMPIYEPGLEHLVLKNTQAGRLRFTTDVKQAVEQALVIFLAVGTPPKPDGSPDLSFVEQAAFSIADYMNGYKVVVTKSTVPIGTGEHIRTLITERKKTRANFGVVSNPEFLREGAAINDFMRPDRVVIGSRDEEAIAIMKDLYRPLYLIEAPFVITSLEAAELTSMRRMRFSQRRFRSSTRSPIFATRSVATCTMWPALSAWINASAVSFCIRARASVVRVSRKTRAPLPQWRESTTPIRGSSTP